MLHTRRRCSLMTRSHTPCPCSRSIQQYPMLRDKLGTTRQCRAKLRFLLRGGRRYPQLKLLRDRSCLSVPCPRHALALHVSTQYQHLRGHASCRRDPATRRVVANPTVGRLALNQDREALIMLLCSRLLRASGPGFRFRVKMSLIGLGSS